MGDTVNAVDFVNRQYESLPYPPIKEKLLLRQEEHYKTWKDIPYHMFSSHMLQKLNHFFYRGNQNFRNTFRMVIAGGGTGGLTVFIAEQLNHTNAEVVYLDFSLASMKISQRRSH